MRNHLRLLVAAMRACQTKITASALAAMCSLDNDGWHVDPGATEAGICEALVGNLIAKIPEVKLARGTLTAPLQVGPSERTQCWFLKVFDHGMCLFDEPVKSPHLPNKRQSARHGSRHVGNPLPDDAPWMHGRHLAAKSYC